MEPVWDLILVLSVWGWGCGAMSFKGRCARRRFRVVEKLPAPVVAGAVNNQYQAVIG